MRLAIAAAVVFASATARADDLADRIDEIARDALAHQTAGISIAIARDGKVVLARGYGLANIEHAVPVTPDTVFHIDSISKNITAAALVQLAEQGKLGLDDDITKYIPDAPTHGKRVTVRQLLAHTSGIFSFTSLPDSQQLESRGLDHAQVLALIRDRALVFEPGTSWRYNNSGFYLAGMVIERVVKGDYATYVRDHVFQPLGMKSSSLCDARAIVPHLASGYELDHGKPVHAALMDWKLPFSGGAICATATDLVTWQLALDAGRVVSAAGLRDMRTPTVLADGTSIDYGLGTRMGSLHGHRVFGHTGTGGGFEAIVEDFPDDHLVIVVLANSGGAKAIGTAIARAALGAPEPKLREGSPAKAVAAAFVGTFDSDEGPVELFARDGKLRYRLPGMRDDFPVLTEPDGTLAVDGQHELRYLLRDGKVSWIFVYTAGLLVDAKVRTR